MPANIFDQLDAAPADTQPTQNVFDSIPETPDNTSGNLFDSIPDSPNVFDSIPQEPQEGRDFIGHSNVPTPRSWKDSIFDAVVDTGKQQASAIQPLIDTRSVIPEGALSLGPKQYDAQGRFIPSDAEKIIRPLATPQNAAITAATAGGGAIARLAGVGFGAMGAKGVYDAAKVIADPNADPQAKRDAKLSMFVNAPMALGGAHGALHGEPAGAVEPVSEQVSPAKNPINQPKPIQTLGEAVGAKLDEIKELLNQREHPQPERTQNEQIQPISEETEQPAERVRPEGVGGVHREGEVGGQEVPGEGDSGAQEVAPLNPGGAESELPPEKQALSKQNNSREAWGDFGGLNKAEEATVEPAAEPPKAPDIISMGGKATADVGEVSKSNLDQLNDAVKGFAAKPSSSPAKAFDLGASIAAVKDSAESGLNGLRAAGTYLKTKLEGKPVFDDFKTAVGDRHLALSESAVNARKFVANATKQFKDPLLQEAISNYVDTGGDVAALKQGLAETKPRYMAGYERALKLSPDEKLFAENLKNYFESRLEDAQKAGIFEQGTEDYIHRMFEQDSKWKRGAVAELRSGVFTGQPTLAKQRVFNYDFEAEKAGLKPVKSFIKRVAAYDLSLNKAIADRKLVKTLMGMTMPDGRPMIDVGGIGTKIKDDAGDTQATLIKPKWKLSDEENAENNRGDFKSYDHPALRKWRWAAQDENGKPVLYQGDVLVHPDAMTKVNALFGRSAIRQNPVGRVALNTGSAVKQTMLDISGFHPVQIAVHGMEHRTFAPVKEIDFTDPDTRGLIRGGLVVGETTGRELFDEGLGGSSLTKFIPYVGPKLAAYKDWLFQSYIPRLKVATGIHALERNRAAFPNLSEDEVAHLTANQMNNAFGELNYAMMGRSATMQDALRLVLLAPDFAEARAGFAGQALTKYGGRPTLNSEGKPVMGEQGKALLLGAGALYLTARILNKQIDDQYHFEPRNAFNVVYNGKAYSLRTVQGDLIHAATDLPGFLRNRLNPVYGRTLLEMMTGRDYFGRKRDAAQQAGDAAKTAIPISARGLFSGREQSLAESFMNAFGVTEHRDSPMNEIYDKAQKWKDANRVRQEPGEFIYDPDKDPYRQIKLAAQFYDVAAVKSEIEKAVKAGESKQAIATHFARMANAPFTGSRLHDVQFIKTLSDDDKKTLESARAEKLKVSKAVAAAMK